MSGSPSASDDEERLRNYLELVSKSVREEYLRMTLEDSPTPSPPPPPEPITVSAQEMRDLSRPFLLPDSLIKNILDTKQKHIVRKKVVREAERRGSEAHLLFRRLVLHLRAVQSLGLPFPAWRSDLFRPDLVS